MWPLLLDMTKDESIQSLRCLELEAYGCLISALRAQGSLSQDKLKLIRDAGVILNISQDRHKAEIRRAVNDEKLNTIAYHVSGQKLTSEDWALEGRRLVPLMQRVAPQTAYSAIADEIADISNKHNRQLPNPSSTERKRPASTPSSIGISDLNKNSPFRSAENAVKMEESKKRKLPITLEGPGLSPHVMGPPKMSRIQQIYRQKTRARQKEQAQFKKSENDLPPNKLLYQQQQLPQQKIVQKPITPPTTSINILQNISIPSQLETDEVEPKIENIEASNSTLNETEDTQNTLEHVPITTKSISPQSTIKPSGLIPKKTITTPKCLTGQKLIVVSNPQSISTTSILQRTLTIPFVKNISVKNFDKFKIVTTTNTTNVLSSLTSSTQSPGAKHKVVTVRTNPTVKKVIPLSQLQILNAKGGIKVLPIGGKIITKTNSGSTPVYIVNSSSMQCLTKCTSSTPVIMTCKQQGSPENKSVLVSKGSQEQNVELSDEIGKEVQGERLGVEVETESVGNEVEIKNEESEEVKVEGEFKTEESFETVENVEEKLTEEVVDEKTEIVQCMNENEFSYANGLSPSIFPTNNV